MLIAFNLSAESKPSAEISLRITSELPLVDPSGKCSGVLSITNIGQIAFNVITDEDYGYGGIHAYRDYAEEKQLLEDNHFGGAQRKAFEREQVKSDYYFRAEKGGIKTLLPSEGISIKIPFFWFEGMQGNVYAAEMFLGHDTWIPIKITPAIGHLIPIGRDKTSTNRFYYSQEGTNQYLYIKEDDKFKRVGEMKPGSKSKKEEKEDIVTFETPDGATNKFTRDQARQIVREREREHKRKNQREL